MAPRQVLSAEAEKRQLLAIPVLWIRLPAEIVDIPAIRFPGEAGLGA
jgi:hypothetical protein